MMKSFTEPGGPRITSPVGGAGKASGAVEGAGIAMPDGPVSATTTGFGLEAQAARAAASRTAVPIRTTGLASNFILSPRRGCDVLAHSGTERGEKRAVPRRM